MSDLLIEYGGLVQAATWAAAVFVLVLSLLCGAIYPRARRWLGGLPPGLRANLLLAWAALPLLGAVALLLVSFAPSLLTWLGFSPDHCHLHPDHPHLCLQHPPALVGGSLMLVVTAAGMTAIVAYAFFWYLDCRRVRKTVHELVRLSALDAAHGMHVVPIDAPLAFAAGMRNPVLFVSSQLLSRLTSEQLSIVMAHERAHAARQEPCVTN